jgi:dTDP-4-amino-4,6-dideoxygalactose transaminase
MRYWGGAEGLSCVRPLSQTEVSGFEREFASYLDVRHVTATRYARTALYLALRALDIRGHEVLLPALTCSVVRDAVCLAGAIPVFVDLEPADLGMNMDEVRQKTNSNTKALIITHYYGNLAGNFDELLSFARERKITAIEDCAHSLGLTHKGQRIGTIGDMAAFSLSKNTLNFNGGLLVCRDEIHHDRVRRLMAGQSKRGRLTECGMLYPIMNGGFRAILDRAVFNRVGKRVSRRSLAGITDAGNAMLNSIPIPYRSRSTTTGRDSGHRFGEVRRHHVGHIEDNKVEVPLIMPSIVAALGRIQLRKLDILNRERVAICNALITDLGCYYLQNAEARERDSVYSFFPMRFEGADIQEIQEYCRARGLSLLTTWPAHQEYWPEQDTENVRRIRDSLLLWFVNPMVTNSEISEMRRILSAFAPLNSAVSDHSLPRARSQSPTSGITKQS